MLTKQLFWKVLSALTCYEVRAVHSENIHKWVLATRDLDPSNHSIAALTALLDALLADRHLTHPRGLK